MRLSALGLLWVFIGAWTWGGCQYLSAPNARVEENPLFLEIHNLDETPWEECTLTLNKEAGEEECYTLKVPSVEGKDSIQVFTAEFSRADGKRFIPLVKQVKTLRIQCKSPMQPYDIELH